MSKEFSLSILEILTNFPSSKTSLRLITFVLLSFKYVGHICKSHISHTPMCHVIVCINKEINNSVSSIVLTENSLTGAGVCVNIRLCVFCIECSPLTFGEDCSHECLCKDVTEVCHPVTGVCHSGCRAGYTGSSCRRREYHKNVCL